MNSSKSEKLDGRPVRKPSSLISIAKQTKKLRIIVVEANDDKAIYEAILDKAIGPANFIIYSPLDLGAGVDGKTGILKIHDELLSTISSNDEHVKNLYFILDKDIDDILGRLNPSKLIVYTNGYNIESDLFAGCDLTHVVAACLLKPKSSCASLELDTPRVKQRINTRWKKWISLCIFVRMHLSDNAPKSYSLKSQIHNADGTLNSSKLGIWHNLLSSKSGLDSPTVAKHLALIDRGVHRLIASNNGHKLVNGKWYPSLIGLELRDANLGGCGGLNGLWGTIVASLTSENHLVLNYRAKLGIS